MHSTGGIAHRASPLIKLQALARFAEDHDGDFHRIEALAKIGNQMRVLDLKRPEVRAGIRSTDKSPPALYESEIGADYDAP